MKPLLRRIINNVKIRMEAVYGPSTEQVSGDLLGE